ncbi:MAG: hypothetical protein HY473_00965 [Candidatus Sungbacteria bacterium]|uniref:Uncharacterized protein n=1 Tax=Candidatus Sungiibacteriota bacterium TaxID=2750080 RepID=A0A933DU67_9BACT|nr:hypothetical protein [Candidatus Sungbacteria bacterium]
MPIMEVSLQAIADELHVLYYAFFKVFSVEALHFPMAETYEQGRWRKVVIGGRPYHEPSVAAGVVEEAEKTQRVFLNAMREIRNTSSSTLTGLTNPIDHWRYKLELGSY